MKGRAINTSSILLWDGENRMRGISDNGYMSLYWYDADGSRTVKRHNGGDAFHLYLPITRSEEDKDNDAAADASDGGQRNHPNTLGDGKVYFYHRDHLGSTMSVTDSVGNYTQIVEYTPTGEVFVEQRNDSICTTPYLFNGKELDEETGLYYYGARYYDPRLSVWYSTDPMQEKYPWVSTYGYCMNNPVNLYDANGEDWYQDEDGTIQYKPSVHSQNDLKGGQIYKFKSYNDKKRGINYRNDGSILYKNETDAYIRMWNQADIHYRKLGEKGGREVGGFILDNGSVLVLPDYLNDSRTTKISDYGYIINGSIVTKGNESFSILAQIHTHQDTSASPKPSEYLVYNYADLGVSLAMGGKPIITIGHDGYLYSIRGGHTKGKHGTVYKQTIELPSGYNKRSDILKGKAKMHQLLIQNR